MTKPLSKKRRVSKNKRAEKLLGKRDLPDNAIPFDQPCELGYHCPACKYPSIVDGNFDERLHWGEYESFLWCSVCNCDYPSCLCYNSQSEIPDEVYKRAGCKSWIDFSIKVFLDTIEKSLCGRYSYCYVGRTRAGRPVRKKIEEAADASKEIEEGK